MVLCIQGPLYVMWENALERLKVLNYEVEYCKGGKKPFSRIHFIFPHPTNLNTQFEDFMDICSWLCYDITKDINFFKRDTFDDPNTASNKLLLSLRKLDFRGSFPVQKIKIAHGEASCTVLDFLTDKVGMSLLSIACWLYIFVPCCVL